MSASSAATEIMKTPRSSSMLTSTRRSWRSARSLRRLPIRPARAAAARPAGRRRSSSRPAGRPPRRCSSVSSFGTSITQPVADVAAVALELVRGGPSPRRRWIVPCWVPGWTLIRLVPESVGTSTVPPRSASATVIGTSTSRLPSSSRLKTGEGATWMVTKRSPAGAPRAPASPLPATRIRVPSLTPAGMFTL